jgi:hypothetical protein
VADGIFLEAAETLSVARASDPRAIAKRDRRGESSAALR